MGNARTAVPSSAPALPEHRQENNGHIHLERGMGIDVRARTAKHLSTSHRSRSHPPAGSGYYSTPASHSNGANAGEEYSETLDTDEFTAISDRLLSLHFLVPFTVIAKPPALSNPVDESKCRIIKKLWKQRLSPLRLSPSHSTKCNQPGGLGEMSVTKSDGSVQIPQARGTGSLGEKQATCLSPRSIFHHSSVTPLCLNISKSLYRHVDSGLPSSEGIRDLEVENINISSPASECFLSSWERVREKVNNDFGGNLLSGGPHALQSWQLNTGNARGKGTSSKRKPGCVPGPEAKLDDRPV
ncbi:unnamed protein product [Pleuronectes platessa]|uniref:Uncharacterized protein n=1 Tax=Pleuronectes platessa TaxID=8262 RepID=A0A9N7VPL2_PLEPL|nr:unnamed protein product [Pleuronectes platessa]